MICVNQTAMRRIIAQATHFYASAVIPRATLELALSGIMKSRQGRWVDPDAGTGYISMQVGLTQQELFESHQDTCWH